MKKPTAPALAIGLTFAAALSATAQDAPTQAELTKDICLTMSKVRDTDFGTKDIPIHVVFSPALQKEIKEADKSELEAKIVELTERFEGITVKIKSSNNLQAYKNTQGFLELKSETIKTMVNHARGLEIFDNNNVINMPDSGKAKEFFDFTLIGFDEQPAAAAPLPPGR